MYQLPHIFYGVDNEQIRAAFPFREDDTDARKIRFKQFPVLIPTVLVQDARGIVALGFPFHRIPRKVRAPQIDTEQRLPISDPLIFGERHIPSRTAV